MTHLVGVDVLTDMLTFDIDLNMMRDRRVRTHLDFMNATVRMRTPDPGETVWVLDEDGARYLAAIESVSQAGFVDLVVDLESRRKLDVVIQKDPRGFSASLAAGLLSDSYTGMNSQVRAEYAT